MKNRIAIAPMYLYIMSFVMLCLGSVFTTFLVVKTWESKEIVLKIFVFFFFFYCIVNLFFLLFKFVYADFDSEERILRYGNFFFKKNVEIDQVVSGGQYLFMRNSVKLKIANEVFYIQCIDQSMKKYLLSL